MDPGLEVISKTNIKYQHIELAQAPTIGTTQGIRA